MNKRRNEELMQKAENALHDDRVKILKPNRTDIKDSYNGQTAALGITIAMSGLRPALAIYQKETDGCKRIEILNAIAVMRKQTGEKPGEAMFRDALLCSAQDLKTLQREIIDCTIALKQVIRTYNLVKS